jgi:UPF0716 protein FxsA
MLMKLLVAFIVVPLVELYLLLQLAQVTSALTTFLVVIVTGVIGSVLARREGVMAWHRFRTALAEGRTPSRELQDALMIVFAAALLLTPGLLTDALGFTLLVPAGRELMRQRVLARYVRRFNVQIDLGGSHPEPARRQSQSGYTVDAEAVRRR